MVVHGGLSLPLFTPRGLRILSTSLNWNSIGGLAGGFIGAVFSTVWGMLKWTWAFALNVLKVLQGGLNLMNFGFGNLYRLFSFSSSIFYMGTMLTRLHELGAIA